MAFFLISSKRNTLDVFIGFVLPNHFGLAARPGQGMEWNGTEISVWNMEDARIEWNGRFQERNGRQSSILIPY